MFQGLGFRVYPADVARHVILHLSNPRVLNSTASYDVAGNILAVPTIRTSATAHWLPVKTPMTSSCEHSYGKLPMKAVKGGAADQGLVTRPRSAVCS